MSLKRMVNLTTRCPQRGRNNPAILTAAPFRGVPQPEAHGRIKFNDTVQRDQFRRVLSRYALAFQGYILSVNCQYRILIRVRRTTTRDSVLVSIFNPEPQWRIKCQTKKEIRLLKNRLNAL
ncbi:predicted protein [Escherichia albertii]|nr:predicted protein [Escherichia albertii]BAT44032.1 predicted protein [Escherichia albertii]